jgi:histidyl-tRNA synthetase
MTELRPVRGTKDFLPDDSRRRRFVEETAERRARLYGYREVSTPVFEFTSVFARTLGDTTDIVTKEMYTFEDRSGDSLTLRPENTAGIVRAFLSNRLTAQLPWKVFYRGPMFRYERPQKGRLRQFHQIGVEVLGVAEPLADVETIALAYDILSDLGLQQRVTLEINTLGDAASRTAYRAVLIDYLSSRVERLSAESRVRLVQNPLRILDSKDPDDRAVIAGAPSIADCLNPSSKAFFAGLLAGLDALAVPYRVNPKLVRGLDYYCHTAFEFTTEALGAQGTVLAGGRYDGLIAQMGGPPTPGTGWAAGVERLMMLTDAVPAAERPVAVVPLGEDEIVPALRLARRLRDAGVTTEFDAGGRFRQRMKWADRIGARIAVIVGPDELGRGAATVKDMDTGAQEEVPLDWLPERLRPPG